jgi:CBS domain-containing protein
MLLRKILTSTRVSQLDLTDVPMLPASATVLTAASEMRRVSHGSALVCDNDRLVGIFTERDLLAMVGAGRSLDTPLGEVMTRDPHSVTLDDTLHKVVDLMDRGGCRRLPVVDNTGKPSGIVDVKGVVRFLVEFFPTGVFNQAPEAKLTAKDREGA